MATLLWRRLTHTASSAVPAIAGSNALPGAVEFNEHLLRHLLEGDADGASSVLEAMREYGIELDTRCDSILRMDSTDLVRLRAAHIKGLVDADTSKDSSCELPLKFFEALLANGVAHTDHLNALLLSCDDKDQRWQIIRRAGLRGQVVPVVSTYNLLLNKALFEGDIAEVKVVLKRMIESETSPSENTKRLLQLQADDLSRMRSARIHSIINSEQPWSQIVKRARACFDKLAGNGAVNAYQLSAIMLTCPTSDEMLALIDSWENHIDLRLGEDDASPAPSNLKAPPLNRAAPTAADGFLPDHMDSNTPLRIVCKQLLLEGDADGVSKLLERFPGTVKISVEDTEKWKRLTSDRGLAKQRTSYLERLLNHAGRQGNREFPTSAALDCACEHELCCCDTGCRAEASPAFKFFDKLLRNGCADTIHFNVILKACSTVAEMEQILRQCAHVIEPDMVTIRTVIGKYIIEGQQAQVYAKLESFFHTKQSKTVVTVWGEDELRVQCGEEQLRVHLRTEGTNQSASQQRVALLGWILGGSSQTEIDSALQFATSLNENRVLISIHPNPNAPNSFLRN
jgi:hypothetical protein